MNWWDALNVVAKDFPEGDPYIEDFRSGMYGKSNALFEPVKSVTALNSLAGLRGGDILGKELGGDIFLSKQGSDPLKVLLHEALHTNERPGNIISAYLKPNAWDLNNRPALEHITDVMADKINSDVSGRSETYSHSKNSMLTQLVQSLLQMTPLEAGTRAGRIIK
jgi:hypothetical protein